MIHFFQERWAAKVVYFAIENQSAQPPNNPSY